MSMGVCDLQTGFQDEGDMMVAWVMEMAAPQVQAIKEQRLRSDEHMVLMLCNCIDEWGDGAYVIFGEGHTQSLFVWTSIDGGWLRVKPNRKKRQKGVR